jgi:hypothetical protein
MGAGELRPEPGTAEPVDRLAVQGLGGLPPLTSARERASTPRPKSVLLACVVFASWTRPSAARPVFPVRDAASISSGKTHSET